MLEELGIYQASLLWERFILVSILFFLYRRVRARKGISFLSFMPFFIGFLVIRDIFLTFFPIADLFIASDTVIFSIYLLILTDQAGNRRFDAPVLILAAASVVLLLVQSGFPFLPEELAQFHRIPLTIYGLFIGLCYRGRGGKDPVFAGSWPAVLFGMLAYNGILAALGEYHPISQTMAVPAFALLPIFFLQRLEADIDKERETQINSLSTELDSLFEFMRNIGSAITEKIELTRVLTYITTTAVKNTGADAGAVLLIEEGRSLTVKAVSGFFPPPYAVTASESSSQESLKETFKKRSLPLGFSVLGEVVQSGIPALIRDSHRDIRLKENAEPGLCHISSLIAIPLIVSRKVLGVLSVVKTKSEEAFSDENLLSLRSFADYTSLTLDNLLTYIELLEKKEMEREVGIAAEIQQKLLPSTIQPIKGGAVSAFSIPAKGVSGDYYDVIPFKDKTVLVICDVAGKGVPASLVMIMIRSIIHLVASPAKDTATIVNWINKGITGRIEIDHFATLSYLLYDSETGVLEYTNAGHLPMLYFRAEEGTLSTVDTPGLPLGIEGSSRYEKKRIEMRRGDLAVLYTDGIIEAMNPRGEQFSMKRLESYIQSHTADSVSDFTEGLKLELSRFTGKAKQHDDQTLLVIKGE